MAEASAPLPLSAHERQRDARTEPLAFAHPDSPLSLAVRRAGGPLTPTEGREGGSKGECVLPWAAAGLAGSLLRMPVELSAPLAPLRPLRPRRCECFAFREPPLLPHRCALLAAATIVPPRLSITDHKVRVRVRVRARARARVRARVNSPPRRAACRPYRPAAAPSTW